MTKRKRNSGSESDSSASDYDESNNSGDDGDGEVKIRMRKPSYKRKPNGEPIVRVVGGRVYDSVNGTSCHQCRQKTTDPKVCMGV
ncbi:hypothetical protein HK102_001583 [Quaeritorhiza haematococci]|nr:hypothetical protein HK102_001583 [Quaeritorhiza haematococci]